MKRIRSKLRAGWHWFKHLSRKKKTFIIILLLVILGIVAGQIANNKKEEYNITKVTRGSITELVSEPGVIASAGTVDVTSPSSGIIEEMYIENGQQVTQGEELFVVKSTATDAEKASAYATYQNAVSALATAQQTKETLDAAMWAKRQAFLEAQNTLKYKNDHSTNPSTGSDYTSFEKEVIDSGIVVAEKDFHASEKKYKEADIEVNAAKAQVDSTLLSYEATRNAVVKAPATGTIANLSASSGDAVQAATMTSAQTAEIAGLQQAPPVLSIVNDVNVSVKISIGQSDISKIKTGQEVVIDPDAYADILYHGRVIRVDSIGKDVSGVVVYYVYVMVTDKDDKLRTGMTADADIITAEKENVLVVPNSAVKPYQGKRAVRVIDLETKELKFIPVKVGIRGKMNSEITDGLQEGQEIVTSLTNEQVKKPGLFQ